MGPPFGVSGHQAVRLKGGWQTRVSPKLPPPGAPRGSRTRAARATGSLRRTRTLSVPCGMLYNQLATQAYPVGAECMGSGREIVDPAQPSLTAEEHECVVANSAWKMIDDIVNFDTLLVSEFDRPTNVVFQTSAHRRLFAILLRDMLSEVRAHKGRFPLGLRPNPHDASGADKTFLYHLQGVARNPALGHSSDAKILGERVEAFSQWLNCPFSAKINLPDIELETEICATRIRVLQMAGDTAKHYLPRLDRNAKLLEEMLQHEGIERQDAFLALENFSDWVIDDFLDYHATQIAVFLSLIRVELCQYLRPQFNRSFREGAGLVGGMRSYRFQCPERITDPAARAMYWELMNRVRAGPIMPAFAVIDSLTKKW